MAKRRFRFPRSMLISASRRLHDAMTDPVFATVMGDRPNGKSDTAADHFATCFDAQLTALGTGDSSQKAQTGQAGTLTRSQKGDFQKMERPVAGARRRARLVFPADHVKLHGEFQVGSSGPAALDTESERAGIILTACWNSDNATALKDQGRLSKDTDALAAAVGRFSGIHLVDRG